MFYDYNIPSSSMLIAYTYMPHDCKQQQQQHVILAIDHLYNNTVRFVSHNCYLTLACE